MNELRQRYEYITDEQWEKVSNSEASYLDFLTEEDLEAHKQEVLEQQEVDKDLLVQGVISQLKSTEELPEARLIIGGAFALQDFFFSQTGRYIGQDLMHQFVQYEPFRGLRIYTMAYETPDGEHGFNLMFKYRHESGIELVKTIPGKGIGGKFSDWSPSIEI